MTITLDNRDLSVFHDVGVDVPGVAHSSTCAGPCQGKISFTAPSPGSYSFFCSTHKEMVGAFIVTP